MKVIFMGTSNFAVPSLEKLVADGGYEIVCVVTPPDRPKGRGKPLEPSPIKSVAESHNLEILQPKKVRLKSVVDRLRKFEPELIVVVAFGQILSKPILAMPPSGCLNIHPSLLPKYRGAAPIQWSLINGEIETGITIMLMDEGEDTGDIVLQRSVPIDADDDFTSLSHRLSKLAPELLMETLSLTGDGKLPPHRPQNHDLATHAPKITKDMGKIDWSRSAVEICNLIRGTSGYLSVYTQFSEQTRLSIIKCSIVDFPNSEGFVAGTIQITPDRRLIVFTGEGSLELTQVQPATKKKMSAIDFINGYQVRTKDQFQTYLARGDS